MRLAAHKALGRVARDRTQHDRRKDPAFLLDYCKKQKQTIEQLRHRLFMLERKNQALVDGAVKAAARERMHLLVSGSKMTKYHYSSEGTTMRHVSVTPDMQFLVWRPLDLGRGMAVSKGSNSLRIQDIRGILFGWEGRNFRRLARLPPFEPLPGVHPEPSILVVPRQWCFSIVTEDRTLDFSIDQPEDLSSSRDSTDPRADLVISWILGLQALCDPNRLLLKWTRGGLLAKRGRMKIRQIALEQGKNVAQFFAAQLMHYADRKSKESTRKQRSVITTIAQQTGLSPSSGHEVESSSRPTMRRAASHSGLWHVHSSTDGSGSAARVSGVTRSKASHSVTAADMFRDIDIIRELSNFGGSSSTRHTVSSISHGGTRFARTRTLIETSRPSTGTANRSATYDGVP